MVDKTDWKRGKDSLSKSSSTASSRAQRVGRRRRAGGPTPAAQNVRSLEELQQVPGIIRDVTGVVGAELDAFVAVRRPPAEYHWIERLVYERWRGALRKAGSYPAVARAAAAEISAVARSEADARVRARLEQLATDMKARVPAPPEGFAPEIHDLLLSRIDDVERWSLDDVVAPYIPVPR
jgi:hypothetical protein